jgi:hypothetical protein
LTASTYDAATGIGTLSFALEGADIAQVNDVGQMVVQSAEIGDPVAQGTASRAMALSFNREEEDSSRCMYAEAVWSGTLPTSATVCLEYANVNSDERFAVAQNVYGTSSTGTIAASDALATIADSAVSQSGASYQFALFRFVRARVLDLVGGDGTTTLTVTLSI